jgi:uncharacterized membrane protein
MNRLLLPAAFTVLVLNNAALWADSTSAGTNPGYVMGGDFSRAHDIIAKKCTPCHSDAKIDAALKSGKDMAAIQKKMEKQGAQLTAGEREVLGIYWKQNPLKK